MSRQWLELGKNKCLSQAQPRSQSEKMTMLLHAFSSQYPGWQTTGKNTSIHEQCKLKMYLAPTFSSIWVQLWKLSTHLPLIVQLMVNCPSLYLSYKCCSLFCYTWDSTIPDLQGKRDFHGDWIFLSCKKMNINGYIKRLKSYHSYR